YGQALGPAVNLRVFIRTAVAVVRRLQQPAEDGQRRRLIGRHFHVDVAQSVHRHDDRMSDGHALAEFGNRNGLFALDAESDRFVEQEPGVVGKEQRAATHEYYEPEMTTG